MHKLSIVAIGSLLMAWSGCAHKPQTRAHRDGDDLVADVDSSKDDGESLGVCGVRVHFQYDSSEIALRDRPQLERAARCLTDDSHLKVTIEGNADERGTEEYNLALGDRRANAVAMYLASLGASVEQLKTVSYGKENPVCNEHQESCWMKNRRAAVRPRQLHALSKNETR
jgi:peptidoglycan-associated lipoprotein